MIMGYGITEWIKVTSYMFSIVSLLGGICFLSGKLADYKYYCRRQNSKLKKMKQIHKKSYFLDVA